MGRSRLDSGWHRLGQPVRVSATIDWSTAVRLDRYAPVLGLSRSAAISEAVAVRMLVWDSQVRRRQRAAVSRLMRDAEGWAPLDELLATAREEGQAEREWLKPNALVVE